MCIQHCRSLRAVAMIGTTLVNIQTHANRQLLTEAQPAELKIAQPAELKTVTNFSRTITKAHKQKS